MGGTVTSQHPGKVTPVLRGRPGLLEVEEEEGAGIKEMEVNMMGLGEVMEEVGMVSRA